MKNKSLYLFPELTDDDLEMLKAYGLTFLGKNYGPDGDEENWVVTGQESQLKRYAQNWLGYELHPDYFYEDEDDFAGDIEPLKESITHSPLLIAGPIPYAVKLLYMMDKFVMDVYDNEGWLMNGVPDGEFEETTPDEAMQDYTEHMWLIEDDDNPGEISWDDFNDFIDTFSSVTKSRDYDQEERNTIIDEADAFVREHAKYGDDNDEKLSKMLGESVNPADLTNYPAEREFSWNNFSLKQGDLVDNDYDYDREEGTSEYEIIDTISNSVIGYAKVFYDNEGHANVYKLKFNTPDIPDKIRRMDFAGNYPLEYSDNLSSYCKWLDSELHKRLNESLKEPINESSYDEANDDDTDDIQTYFYDDDSWEDSSVSARKDFIEDGNEFTWVKRHGDVEHLDFDNWAVWEAYCYDDAETYYFVVDEDTGFIDWGPVDTLEEAQEFLASKVSDWEDLDEDFNSEENSVNLSDVVNDSIIVFTDDIDSITGDWVASQYKSDDEDDILEDTETGNKTNSPKIIVSIQDLNKILDNLKSEPIKVVRRKKNKEFMSDYALTDSDVKSILSQLEAEDYSHSKISTNELYAGDVLTVFITGRQFTLSDKTVDGLTIYIKVDDSDEGLVTVVSIHEAEHQDDLHPYGESKSIKEAWEPEFDESEWEQEDIDLWKSIDWKSRNYEDYPVPEDSFEYDAVAYGLPGGKQVKKVKFIKYLRSNPIFPPYYAPEKKVFDHTVGPMYDGHERGKYGVHNRYETQEVYDMLSEAFEDGDELETAEQKISSANTSINSSKLPAIFKMVKFTPGKLNLDFGGGKFDNATEFLAEQGVESLVYDPYNRTAKHNEEVLNKVRKNGGADTITLSNVLNVIAEPEARLAMLRNCKKLLKADGTLYITVYEGTRNNDAKETKSGYQLNKKTADYLDEISSVFSNVDRKGKLIIAR